MYLRRRPLLYEHDEDAMLESARALAPDDATQRRLALAQRVVNASAHALDLMTSLLSFEPDNRATAVDALCATFLAALSDPSDEATFVGKVRACANASDDVQQTRVLNLLSCVVSQGIARRIE